MIMTRILMIVLEIAAIIAAIGLVAAATWFAYACAVLPILIHEWRARHLGDHP